MRKEWIDVLSKSYSEDELRDPDRVADRLAIELPGLRGLIAAVFEDLDVTNYGIGWWAGTLDVKRRILIGDHLLQVAVSVSRNLIEARLHELELEDISDRESTALNSAFMSGAQTGDVLGFPPNPLAELWIPLGDVHIVGFLRAIGSALDCLGTAAIGVLGLPTNLFKSDWGTLKRVLSKQLKEASEEQDDGIRLWEGFGVALQESIDESGPDGWLDWTLDARNMLVHRSRRINMRVVDFVGPTIAIPNQTYRRAVSIPALWLDPKHSEVEVLREGRHLQSIVLGEPALSTIAGIRASALALTERVCTNLLGVWLSRRRNPHLLAQPEAQWPDTNRKGESTFRGYQEGTLPTAGLDSVYQHPSDAKRLRSADLLDEALTWRTPEESSGPKASPG